MSALEQHFELFRKNVAGFGQRFHSPCGEQELIYADWTASGRVYNPIEEKMRSLIAPFVGNTHSESNLTGGSMTKAYHHAHRVIKRHVNAGPNDVIITAGSGMTGVVNKFQRILGLRVAEQLRPYLKLPPELKPVVFVTHMEHHSNQTSWLETIADVVVIPPDEDGLVNVEHLEAELPNFASRTLKIGAFTACSNVTGISTPYHDLARVMHRHGGFCFVDFAASAPYVDINMHPCIPGTDLEDVEASLDAIFFSPHKFLGGPGSSGVLIFNSRLYNNTIPDDPGGGTVQWTNPWGEHRFISDIEAREDGGTPGFLQAIRAALAIQLKEEMGVENIVARERELVHTAMHRLAAIPGVQILAGQHKQRLGILSFLIDGLHYNLVVKLLNDRYGIQVRGGCSCAGTYGHYLLHLDRAFSREMADRVDHGDLSIRPGWVRLSVHPIMSNRELEIILDAIDDIARNGKTYAKDYHYNATTNEFVHKSGESYDAISEAWFAPEHYATDRA